MSAIFARGAAMTRMVDGCAAAIEPNASIPPATRPETRNHINASLKAIAVVLTVQAPEVAGSRAFSPLKVKRPRLPVGERLTPGSYGVIAAK